MASGFGWYSLSGILLTESFARSSVARRSLTISSRAAGHHVNSGLIRRSRSTALGLCGATSMDFTLPVLQRSGGVEIVLPPSCTVFCLVCWSRS
ncbi:LysO family transporter [Klebsiella pneumoniae]|uniref:LysO family transporter n=1 Tax=Klebsiella pneumoniae TaxID=573 RepID=A0A939SPE3_KLEPN|nr:LysO family transporter [Klebsiella pneumoniae]